MMPFLHWVCKISLAKKRKKGKRNIVINGTLEDNFRLDITAKAKPATGPDDLLLLFVQHWARDKSVFPTEDDRHDIITIMLFQSYTGGRPAEFVH
ncbi:hypothetical protein BofuT4_uP085680.1 [Botrytis cinerea T4]|uniref:Uncharacterized protein n=1 Tax=Botryotinia fuckeliana (strain T4) TaxID=999810 RepID=G2YHL9_BOTF4|nr:hypothetical protein BofuT4_uP085680.1 [Botrytis cinerea T4]